MIGAAVLVLAAVGAFWLVNNRAGDELAGRAVATNASASPTATASPTASATSTATAATSAPAAVPAMVAGGRNPFLQPGGTPATGSLGSSGPGSPASTSAFPSTSASPSASPSTSSGTAGSSGTTGPIYLGLYAFSGNKAVFWVNDTRYQVAVGGSFADFTYTSKTSSDCARVRWGKDGTPTTIAPAR